MWSLPLHHDRRSSCLNARLTVHGRRLLVQRVRELGMPVAHVAKAMGISRQCAHESSQMWHKKEPRGFGARQAHLPFSAVLAFLIGQVPRPRLEDGHAGGSSSREARAHGGTLARTSQAVPCRESYDEEHFWPPDTIGAMGVNG